MEGVIWCWWVNFVMVLGFALILNQCQDILCICTKLHLRGRVSCIPAALLFISVNQHKYP